MSIDGLNCFVLIERDYTQLGTQNWLSLVHAQHKGA